MDSGTCRCHSTYRRLFPNVMDNSSMSYFRPPACSKFCNCNLYLIHRAGPQRAAGMEKLSLVCRGHGSTTGVDSALARLSSSSTTIYFSQTSVTSAMPPERFYLCPSTVQHFRHQVTSPPSSSTLKYWCISLPSLTLLRFLL